MIDTKLSLTIILPGRVMWSQGESLKTLKKPVRNKKGRILKTKDGQPITRDVAVPDFAKNDSFNLVLRDGDKEVTETVYVRKCKPAKQVINLTEEAYNNMLSKDAPYGYRGPVAWSKLSKNQKVKWHCIQIATQLGGVFDSFQVLD